MNAEPEAQHEDSQYAYFSYFLGSIIKNCVVVNGLVTIYEFYVKLYPCLRKNVVRVYEASILSSQISTFSQGRFLFVGESRQVTLSNKTLSVNESM